MDEHMDAPSSRETWPRLYLKLFGPPLCVLLTGLLITAIAEQKSATLAWTYGVLITGFAAFICALVTFSWHRETRAFASVRKELLALSLQVNNMQTEKRILRQALNDSEQRSRDLVSLSGGVVFELDEQGQSGYVSEGVASILGFAPADLANITVHSLILDSDRDTFDRTLMTARQDRQLQRTDLVILDVDRQPVPVTIRVLALHDTLHGFSGFRLSIQSRNPPVSTLA